MDIINLINEEIFNIFISEEEIKQFGEKGKPVLGAKLYVKPSDVPSQIIEWAKSIIGSGFQNNIYIQKTNGWFEITMPWHEGDKETHQYFRLIDNNAVIAGNSVSKSGWSEVNATDVYGIVPIPSGFVLATVGTYPKRLRIVTSPDALDVLDSGNDILNKLSDEMLVALYQAKALKPFARNKFNENVYQELISLGLMNKQRAITIEGKNLLNSPKTIERLKEIAKKDWEENKWNRKYNLPNL